MAKSLAKGFLAEREAVGLAAIRVSNTKESFISKAINSSLRSLGKPI